MAQASQQLINGRRAESISSQDRGLLFGDGLFETIACVNGHVQFLEQHLARLEHGASVLGIPRVERQLWQDDIAQLIDAGQSQVIKLLLTRGAGGFGYASPARPSVTRIAMRLPWPMQATVENDTTADNEPLHIGVLNTRLGSNRQLSGLKHLNRLEQVLAAQELAARELQEGLLLSQQGFVVEAVSANVFFVFDGRLVTPLLDCSGVQGVARDVLLEQAQRHGVDIGIEYIDAAAALTADEILLTNSVRGVRRVTHVESSALKGVAELTTRDSAGQQLEQWWQQAITEDRQSYRSSVHD